MVRGLSNMWAYRTDPVVENQPTSQPTMDAAVDTRVNSGEDAVIEQNAIQHDPDSVCPCCVKLDSSFITL